MAPRTLAAVIDSLDGLDESLHDFYAQAQDGKFVLALAGRPRGFVPQGEHEEFRTNNVTLTKERDTARTALATFEGVDVDEYKTLKGTKDELDRKALVKAGDMEGLVAAEVEKAVKPLSAQLETANTTVSDLQNQLSNKVVDEEILKAGNAFGKMKSGTEDVLVSKAKSAGFKNVDGELRQVIGEQTQYSIENPGSPMTIKEWIQAEGSKTFSWVWEPSKGGGGGGNDGAEHEHQEGATTVAKGDKAAFAKNLDDIAKGKAVVR